MSKRRDENATTFGEEQAKGGDGRVGYCRPPLEHQFKPGRSGNPKGRPKHAESLRTIARRRFAQKIPMREGGKVHRVSTLEAGMARLVEKALQGDLRAMVQFLISHAPWSRPRCKTSPTGLKYCRC